MICQSLSAIVHEGVKEAHRLLMESPAIRVEGMIGEWRMFEDLRLDWGAESPGPPRRASIDRRDGG